MLEAFDIEGRLEILSTILTKEIEILKIESSITNKVRTQINKSQREYYLKEQLRVIQEELGDEDMQQVDEMRAKLQKTPLNDEAREKVGKELDRLARTAPGTPETTVSRMRATACELSPSCRASS